MNILSIDTSTDKVSVSLKINDDVDSLENKQEIRASQIILSMIDKILRKHNINCKDLTAITFNKGPASFTGTRIASSVTQAIGYAWQIPVFGVSSLTIMAFDYFKRVKHSEIICIKKAYSQKIFWAVYKINENSFKPVSGNHISNFAEIKFDSNCKWHGISDCWDDYESGLNPLIDKFVDKINIKEAGNSKKIIDFVLSNEEINKKFDYKDTLPEYVSHDLFD